MISIDLQKYEIVRFSTKITNSTTTKTGYRIGKFLVVGFSDARREAWRIYRSQDGMECLKTTFQTAQDAIQCAEWIRKHYEPFFFIWTVYTHIDLWRLTHYTIKNGKKYMNFIKELDKQRNVRWEDVCQVLD